MRYTSGEIHTGYRGIYRSYQEALRLFVKENSETQEKDYYYPLEKEIQLIGALRNGNFGGLRMLLVDLKAENDARGLSPKSALRVPAMIYEVLKRYAAEAHIPAELDGERFMELMDEEDATGLWQYLTKQTALFEEALQMQSSIRSLGRSLVKYVNENYTDSSLSLQVLADRFGVSRPTVSKDFKETVGMGFVEYLHSLRTEYAKKLILQGNYDVMDVAGQCGYESEITFKRAFVKNMGLTPREYIRQKRVSPSSGA